jgi:hypothetical protein
MSAIIQADQNGVLHLPPSILPGSAPGAEYKVDQQNGAVLISKSTEAPTPSPIYNLPPELRAKAFLEWVDTLPPGPGLSDYAVSRESIYD